METLVERRKQRWWLHNKGWILQKGKEMSNFLLHLNFFHWFYLATSPLIFTDNFPTFHSCSFVIEWMNAANLLQKSKQQLFFILFTAVTQKLHENNSNHIKTDREEFLLKGKQVKVVENSLCRWKYLREWEKVEKHKLKTCWT